MTKHPYLDCIWAISSDCVTLFVSHCDKVLWLTIIIPLSSESFFKFSFPSHITNVEKKKKKKALQFCGIFFKTVSCRAIVANIFNISSKRERQKQSAIAPGIINRGIQAHLCSTYTLQLCSSVYSYITNRCTAVTILSLCKITIFWKVLYIFGLCFHACPGLLHQHCYITCCILVCLPIHPYLNDLFNLSFSLSLPVYTLSNSKS